MPATAVPQQQLRPFRYSSRQRERQIRTVDIQLGSSVPIEVPKVGYVNRFYLWVDATLNCTANGGVVNPLAPFNLLKSITVQTNGGQSKIYDVSGFGTFVVNDQMLRYGNVAGNSDIAGFSGNAGNNHVYFGLEIPIAINDEDQQAMGLIALQAPSITMTVTLQFANAGTDIISTFNTIAGTVEIGYLYYEQVDLNLVASPPPVVHRIFEDNQAITAVGDQTYSYPRGGTLLQMAHYAVIGGVLADMRQGQLGSNFFTGAKLVLNTSDTWGETSAHLHAMHQHAKTGRAGFAWLWNFFDSGYTGNGSGDFRDALSSMQLSEFQAILTVAAGLVPGNNSHLFTVRRVVHGLS